MDWTRSGYLSKAGHVKPCLNPRGPSRKAKYSSLTDSEPVPLGKGEKNPVDVSAKYLKPCAYKQWEDYARKGMSDRVPIA